MTSNAKNDSKPSPDEAVAKAVKEYPGTTIDGVSKAAGIARSTAGKALGRLADASTVTRHAGGRDGGKRLPDRFTEPGVDLPAAYAEQASKDASDAPAGEPAASGKGKPAKAKLGKASGKKGSTAGKPAASGKAERLSAGGLDPLVIDYLKKNRDSAPHGPSQVAKALGRSSGAVGNCLVRLTDAKTTKEVTKKPRRYDLAA